MLTKNKRIPKAAPTPWYRSPGFTVVSVFIGLIAWLIFTAINARQLETQPTRLILRSDTCGFLKIKGVPTTLIEPGNWCSVVVPFRTNPFGGGGVIKLGDQEIRVSVDQIIEVNPVIDQPWAPEQTHAAIWMGISGFFLLVLVGWMAIN